MTCEKPRGRLGANPRLRRVGRRAEKSTDDQGRAIWTGGRGRVVAKGGSPLRKWSALAQGPKRAHNPAEP